MHTLHMYKQARRGDVRYQKHCCRSLRRICEVDELSTVIFAMFQPTTLHFDGAKFKVGLQFVQHCQNINDNMITTEISRFMHENVHRSVYT